MFGFVGKLVGSVLSKVGLDFLAPIVSMGINFLSGNYLGMIGDIKNMVSQFSNFSFLDKVSKNPPLGQFGANRSNDFVTSRLLNSDFGSWRSQSQRNDLMRANQALDVVYDYLNQSSRIQSARTNIQFNYIAA
jgi:hypothetical protein